MCESLEGSCFQPRESLRVAIETNQWPLLSGSFLLLSDSGILIICVKKKKKRLCWNFTTPSIHVDKSLPDSSFTCYATFSLHDNTNGPLRPSLFHPTTLVVTVWQGEHSNLMLRSGSDLIVCPRVFRQPRGGASSRFHDASGHHQYQDGSERGDSGAGMHR